MGPCIGTPQLVSRWYDKDKYRELLISSGDVLLRKDQKNPERCAWRRPGLVTSLILYPRQGHPSHPSINRDLQVDLI